MLRRQFLIFAAGILLGCFLVGTVFVPCVFCSTLDSPTYQAESAGDDAVWMVVPSGTTEILSDVWGSGDTYYAVGSRGTILRFDGSHWVPMDSGGEEDFQGVWGTSTNNVYAVGGGGAVLHYNGERWAPVSTPTIEFLRGAWGTSPDNIFVTGTRGTILHYDGIQWESMESNSPNRLYDIWGAAGDDVFVAGHLATILHYDGSIWSPIESGVRPTLWGVWGTSGGNVFVVGGSGVIVRYDGSVWQTQESGTTEDLLRVWGDRPDNIFAVGSGGTILRYNGQEWTSMTTPVTRTLKGVIGNAAGTAFAVGDAGTILRLSGSIPVYIDYFDAAIVGSEVILEWRVRATDGIDTFAIRRCEIDSGDCISFRFDAATGSAHDTSVQPGEMYKYALTVRLTDGSRATSQWVEVAIPYFRTELSSVHPNPFNPTITIRYRVVNPAPVDLSIYDVRGKLVRRLVDQPAHTAGEFEIEWDGSGLDGMRAASGVYFCSLDSDGHNETRRIVLIK